jgi:beta-lactam-binding protein with PASTA domain
LLNGVNDMNLMKVLHQNESILNFACQKLQRDHASILLQFGFLVCLLFLICGLPATADAVEVPDVVGSPQATAEAAIISSNLSVGVVTPVNSATVPIGAVIGQDPAAGINVVSGSQVDLVISGVTVPNVVGLAQAAAQTTITAAGLTVGTGTTANSATVPIGNVISQTPAAGTNVLPGNAVTLVISLGTAVPDLVGLTQAAAQTAITAAGLTVGTRTTTNSATVPSGRVISQAPAAGSNVPPGSAVALVVSLGAKVPNVVGLTQAAAEAAITSSGLTVGTVTTANSTTVPAGTVISQSPTAGTNVAPATAVTLVVSLGVEVPNVVGLTQAAAQTEITSASLTVGTVTTANSSSVAVGKVISQNPAAGAKVEAGSAVALVVSLGAKVPNVVGSSKGSAQTALTAAGLKVGTVTSVNSQTVAIGNVISQNPTAGFNVAPGSAVALVVSLGTAVPNVVNKSQAAAQAAIAGVGLTVGNVTSVFSDTVALGNVISQNPTAGTNVSPGSGVGLVISSGPPVLLMGVQNDPKTGPLVNSLYRLRTDGVVTKIADLNHRTHGLAYVGSNLYSVEELTLAQQPGTPPNLYRLNPSTGAMLATMPLSLSTGESLEGGRGLATMPGTNQLWGLLVVTSEVNSFRRLVTINPTTGRATQIAKIPGRFMDLAFDAAGTLYAITDNRPVPGGAPPFPARIYTLNRTTGAAVEFLDVSAGAVAGQSNFRESETIGVGSSPDLLYHLSGQHKVTACCTKNILFETIHRTTKVRTPIRLTGPDFFVTTALTLVPPTNTSTGTPALADLDASGTTDLVWQNTQDGSTAIWLMNGTTIAATGFPGGVPAVWQIAGVGDVNGDGKGDVIWRNSTSGTVAVWLMNGVSVTSVGFPGSASLAFEISGVGDVNGDGKADLVWRNRTDGSTAIWLMNGTKIAAPGFPGGVPVGWQITGVGDVNGDSKADVIWRNGASGTVAVWLMNGLGIAGVGFPGSASTAFEIAGVGDVNGDGKADLVWRNTNDGSTAIWLMNGTKIAAPGFPGGVPLAWQISQVGDVNGDGKSDVIWRNGRSGIVAVWLMNGASISSVGFPGSAPSDWEIQ